MKSNAFPPPAMKHDPDEKRLRETNFILPDEKQEMTNMRGFTPSRRMLLVDFAVVLAVGALSFGAYLSLPADSETFNGLGISARGTINSIDTSMRMLNISHEPVKALESQKMTMDFGVAPNIDLNSLRVGSKVVFTLTQRNGDLYVIGAIKPTM